MGRIEMEAIVRGTFPGYGGRALYGVWRTVGLG